MSGATTLQDRSAWSRGVLASCFTVTSHREMDDTRRFKLSIRDAMFVALGIAGAWGGEVAIQSRTQAAIENLSTKMDGYIAKQTEHDIEMQRQMDEIRKQAALGVVIGNDAKTEAARLEGIMMGAGVLKGDRR